MSLVLGAFVSKRQFLLNRLLSKTKYRWFLGWFLLVTNKPFLKKNIDYNCLGETDPAQWTGDARQNVTDAFALDRDVDDLRIV